MNSKDLLSYSEADKWQNMLQIVSKHSVRFEHNTSVQFKKLVLYRFLSENILVFLLQYIGLSFNVLTVHPLPMWLASGTACAFIFLRGMAILPGIWLGSFCAYYFANITAGIASCASTIYTLQAVLLLWFSYRYVSTSLIFHRISNFIKFILLATSITSLSSLLLSRLFYPPSFLIWLQWMLANLNGILILSCAFITWDTYFPEARSLRNINKLTFSLFYGLLLLCIIGLSLSYDPILTIGLALSTLFIILKISICFGWCGAISSVLIFGSLLNLAVFLNAPTFATEYAFSTLIFLQLILSLSVIIGLIVATYKQLAK